jgi:hypothetical protein
MGAQMLPMPGWTEVVSDTGIVQTGDPTHWWEIGMFRKDCGHDSWVLVFRPNGHAAQQGVIKMHAQHVISGAYHAILAFRGENGHEVRRAILLQVLLERALREGGHKPGGSLHDLTEMLERGAKLDYNRIDMLITAVRHDATLGSADVLRMIGDAPLLA